MSKDIPTGLPELAEHYTSAVSPMPAALDLDPGKYLTDLADFDITEAQKIELLQTLWSIMRAFVDLGFEVDICEQLFGESEEISGDALDGVELSSSQALERPTNRDGKETSA
ncbi:hypothetical protein GGE65_005453 [Skermanella aerolata]|uniref:hypothetical protein n=1 Tax=Skermanella aerolata TaxID=393310 RepID=UPI003D198E5A